MHAIKTVGAYVFQYRKNIVHSMYFIELNI